MENIFEKQLSETYLMQAHLIVMGPRRGDKEGPFRSSSQAAISCYLSNHSKL